MPIFKPFKNEKDSITLAEFTVENRLDHIALYGSLTITRDQAGLALAKQLASVANSILATLRAEKLPEHIAIPVIEKIDNPFNE